MRDKGKYVVCMYIRLSREDTDIMFKDESGSITAQRNLLYEFLREHDEFTDCEVIERCDDGFSGTNFDNRPAFNDMIELAKKGEIQCIIVKDFSRFGRDYVELGDYLEQFFPFLNIRFISVNDGYDSDKLADGETGGLDMAFKNLVYDFYTREASRKQKIAWRRAAEKGENRSTLALYGYQKSKTEKGKLVIDPDTAPIVKEIFEMRLAGMKLVDIAKNLNDRNIPCPQDRHMSNGIDRRWRWEERKRYWRTEILSDLLRNEKYTGTMVSLRSRNNPVTKKREATDMEEWVRVKGTHEAIVDYNTFLRVRATLNMDKTYTKSGHRNVYYCGSCGRALGANNHGWIGCTLANVTSEKKCINVRGNIKEYDKAVLMTVKNNVQIFLSHMEVEKYKKKKCTESLEVQISRIEKTIVLENEGWMKLYDSYLDGALSREEFVIQKKEYDDTIKGMEERLKQLREKNKIKIEGVVPDKDVMEDFLCADKLTEEIKDMFIKKVYIYSKQRIKIEWKFDGFSLIDENMGEDIFIVE